MPAKTVAPKPTVATAERKPRQPRVQKPDTGTETGQPAEETQGGIHPNLKRHLKADAESLNLRLETMAHALIFDITSLPDVISRLYDLVPHEDRESVVDKFFEYYVPRLEVLIEEDYLLGNITALSDLGEWIQHDRRSHGDYDHYSRILSMLKKPLELSPAQLSWLLDRSAVLERENPSRGENWIPKSSRRASAK